MPAKVVQLNQSFSDDEALVFVPPGNYEFACIGYETKRIFNTEKLYMHFRIVTQGPDFGKILTRYYGVTIIGKTGKSGRFSAGWKSDLMFEHVKLFGQLPKRKSEVPITPYKNNIIVGRVETVTKNRNQRSYPEPLQYSKIAELIRIEK